MIMNKKSLFIGLGFLLLTSYSCSTYHLLEIKRSLVIVDKRYDEKPDSVALSFLRPYKQHVDSIMTPIVGQISENMSGYRPESPLSNLLADILLWAGGTYNEKPDFAVYNIGGIRSSLVKGNVTYGDVLDVAPFENKICFLTLKGTDVIELFRNIASSGGEGVSHGVNLVITKDGNLVSCELNGKQIDENHLYRVSTIDYLAQGNDKMLAFKNGLYLNSPKSNRNDTRYIIADFFRQKMKEGIVIESKIEGRIKVNK